MTAVRPRTLAILSGGALGGLAVLLTLAGNPKNTGLCISCFLGNLAGSLHLFTEGRMSYPRPELMGLVLGAFAAATLAGGFRARTTRAPLSVILAAAAVIVGCEVFIGCPIKLVLRLAAGDLTSWAGAAGLVVGVGLGSRLLLDGWELERTPGGWGPLPYLATAATLALAGATYLRPAFMAFGATGPATRHAPLALSLGAGLVLGALAQRSGFCVTGALRNVLLAREGTLLAGLGAFLAAAFAAAVLGGTFHLGYYDQPGVHPDALWNFLGMFLAGLGSVYLGGCPFRQLVLSGTGDTAAGLAVASMLVTAALTRTLGIASTADGPTWAGKVALLAGLCLLLGTAGKGAESVPGV
ncbi:YedE-related selenium metabolism membrane protein [Candidatus Dependentiae bacterium]|nr:YedE-related selenium metabolism membrane protein [Candidatus Dependentiae bacterium]